jgi:hypothetical protein
MGYRIEGATEHIELLRGTSATRDLLRSDPFLECCGEQPPTSQIWLDVP